jgi:hypothetical protein
VIIPWSQWDDFSGRQPEFTPEQQTLALEFGHYWVQFAASATLDLALGHRVVWSAADVGRLPDFKAARMAADNSFFQRKIAELGRCLSLVSMHRRTMCGSGGNGPAEARAQEPLGPSGDLQLSPGH